MMEMVNSKIITAAAATIYRELSSGTCYTRPGDACHRAHPRRRDWFVQAHTESRSIRTELVDVTGTQASARSGETLPTEGCCPQRKKQAASQALGPLSLAVPKVEGDHVCSPTLFKETNYLQGSFHQPWPGGHMDRGQGQCGLLCGEREAS